MIGLFTPPSLRPLPISASYCGHSTGALKTKRNSTEPQTTMRSAASINAAMASLSAEQHSGKPRAPLGRWCGAFHRVRLACVARIMSTTGFAAHLCPYVFRKDNTRIRIPAASCPRFALSLSLKAEGAGNAGCPLHPQPGARGAQVGGYGELITQE